MYMPEYIALTTSIKHKTLGIKTKYFKKCFFIHLGFIDNIPIIVFDLCSLSMI